MTKKEAAQKYITWANMQPVGTRDEEALSFIIELCEDNQVLFEEVVLCKFNPLVFYAICKSIVNEWNAETMCEKLELVKALVEKVQNEETSNF